MDVYSMHNVICD